MQPLSFSFAVHGTINCQLSNIPVLVLCGGFATRLGGVPKHLIELEKNVRLIDLSLGPVLRCPIRRIVLATGSHHDEMIRYANNLKNRTQLDVEAYYQDPIGTSEAILGAIKALDLKSGLIVWHADDVIPETDLAALYAFHVARGANITIVVARYSNPGSREVFVKDGRITSTIVDKNCRFFASGTMVLGKEAIGRLTSAPHINLSWRNLIDLEEVYAYPCRYMINVNTPNDVRKLCRAYHLFKLVAGQSHDSSDPA